MTAGAFLSTPGDFVSWDALDEAERAFYDAPMAEGIVEHVCRYWQQVTTDEFLFEHPEYVPDVP
jgi:hypothetical protein